MAEDFSGTTKSGEADTTVVLKGADAPVLNRAKPIADVYGDYRDARYCQKGHYFNARGEYLFSDVSHRKVLKDNEAEAEARKEAERLAFNARRAERNVTPEEAAALIEANPKDAEEVGKLSLAQLRKAVHEAGGPEISGEGSQKLMIGWLLKYTS